MSKKHLTLENRTLISNMLNQQESFKQIARALGIADSTVSREIRNHLEFKKTGGYGRPFNSCKHRFSCSASFLCTSCSSSRQKNCRFCDKCSLHCPDFVEQKCERLSRPPYVCNGCTDRMKCTLEKCFYSASSANAEYLAVLSESRSGLSFSEDEIRRLDNFISPLIFKGQSINHIWANNKDILMVSESTIYRMISYNLFSARNIDLPRKVRYSNRRIRKHFKVDKACRNGRNFEDFQIFLSSHPDLPVVEMDSVEGRKGGKVLLTLHFVKAEFMLAFLRDSNDSQSVIDIIERLYLELRPDIFQSLFPILLGDNGSEFSNPISIEFDKQGNRRTNVFYCDPSSPGQKGSAERNHELIRYVLPKGSSFDNLTQQEISLLMNHVNSLSRESIGNKCPYEMFEFLYGKNILNLLGCKRIPPNDVTLIPALLKTSQKTAFQEAGSGQSPEV